MDIIIALVIVLIAVSVWLRMNRDTAVDLRFYRKYRIQDYNGPGNDLVISHEQLLTHKLASYEDQFLFILFGETGQIACDDDTILSVRVESQSTDSEQAIYERLESIIRTRK